MISAWDASKLWNTGCPGSLHGLEGAWSTSIPFSRNGPVVRRLYCIYIYNIILYIYIYYIIYICIIYTYNLTEIYV